MTDDPMDEMIQRDRVARSRRTNKTNHVNETAIVTMCIGVTWGILLLVTYLFS